MSHVGDVGDGSFSEWRLYMKVWGGRDLSYVEVVAE